MTDEQEKMTSELEKVEKAYEGLLENFLFGRLGITKRNYIKYEEVHGDGSIFENPKECFICNLIEYLIHLSKAKAFLELEESSLKGDICFYYLKNSFEEIVLNASHQDLTEEEEISGILTDIFPEHLSVSYKLRKKNHEIVRKENEKSSH